MVGTSSTDLVRVLLVPTLLVFGIMPRTVLAPSDLLKQKERMQAMESARIEMAKFISQRRINTALRSNIPAATSSNIAIGSEVLIYRKTPINKWVGPHKVCDSFGKHVFVESKGRLAKFSMDKIKMYRRDENTERETRAVLLQPPQTSAVQDSEIPRPAFSEEFDDLVAALRRDVGALKLAADEPIRNDEFCVWEEGDILLTKILSPSDPNRDSDYFRNAKASEVDGLARRGTWIVVKKKDLPRDANPLGGRFVLTIKGFGTEEEKPKARFVVQGHMDKDKEFMVHNTTNLRQRSVRVIVSFAAVMGHRIFSYDVKQAYLQSEEELSRKVYKLPKRKDFKFFNLTEEEALDLRKPLYGNGDSGDYWGVTFDRHAKQDLHMTPTAGDPSLYIIVPGGSERKTEEDDEPEGCMGNYVDDGLLAGNEAFQKLTNATLQKFESRERVWDNFEFFGCELKTISPG